jgi:hypothetical protein
MVRARLRADQGECDACVLDISTRGLSATAATPPKRGEFVELSIGKNNIVGIVKWSGDRRFGIAFRERVSVIAAISGEGDLVMATRRTVRNEADRRRSPRQPATGRKAEYVIMAIAAAAATVLIADFASTALQSLDTVDIALASAKVSG